MIFTADNTGLIAFIVICLIALVILIPILSVQTAKAKSAQNKMVKAGPVIKKLSERAKQKLLLLGIKDDYEDYSTAGYEYFEYKTKYNYVDNVHIVIDRKTKQIVGYQLIPFIFDPDKIYEDLCRFSAHKFSDLVKAELTTNLGVINSTQVGTGVGTSFGRAGVGVGVSNGVSTQMVNSILVTLYFKDGTTEDCNFLHNRSTEMGGDFYNTALSNAKRFLAICELIIKESQVQPKEDNTSKLIEFKKLLDAGIITQEEFDAKKKQLLDL